MKKILLFIAIITSLTVGAQVSAVSLQASGLTCSMCSNAINKSLRTLDFVKEIDADMKTYTFEISFKPGSVVDLDLLRKKVESAGFTVCSFVATIHFDHVQVTGGRSVVIQNNEFLFLHVADQLLDGDKQVKIIDKGFVSPKEYKKNMSLVASPPVYHATL